MPKKPSNATAAEVGGVFYPGMDPLPGKHGPYPGPWFTLSVGGALYRGRYTEESVWRTEHGARYSQLPNEQGSSLRASEDYARLRGRIVADLLLSGHAWTPREVAVALRNHPETDPAETERLEASQDWHQASALARGSRPETLP